MNSPKNLQGPKKRLFLSPPHMSGLEIDLVREAFESNYIAPLGPQVDAFEREFARKVGIKHALAVSSGTAAMHLALRVLGVGPGDEVVASTLTFIGSVSPIIFQGATPVFIDSEPGSWNMSPEALGAYLMECRHRGKMPKAVVPTDIYGQCADYDRLAEICGEYGIPLVSDAAEALGARYTGNHSGATGHGKQAPRQPRHAGSGATASVYSFNGNKIITTSGGGMLASEDQGLIDEARFLSQQARDLAPHYEHSHIGYNYRMSNILAAIGRGQLRFLEERVRRKREIFDEYHRALGGVPGIDFMPEASHGLSNRWLTVILIDRERFGVDHEHVRLALTADNIESRPIWKPMHLQSAFRIIRDGGDSDGEGPGTAAWNDSPYPARQVGGEVAEDLFSRGLCLPSGTAMTRADLDRVIRIILNCRK